jgi:PcaR/PcaU/PobR family beta-ketoadipate pathway transcriptional regulator
MARRDSSPDFIEAIARGLDVIRAFGPGQHSMSLAAVASATGLPRPTARRILLTLENLGYVRFTDVGYELTPRVLDLGMSYVLSRGLWEVAQPHMAELVARTRESSSIAQLDGSDIVYVARVAVPKIVTLSVTVGTRFPALPTSLGKVLLAALPFIEAERCLSIPSRSGILPRWQPDAAERARVLREVRARGWAVTDEQLAPGIRSVAVPLRDGDGRVIAALNVNAHAAETPLDVLTSTYLPLLLRTAGAISADWAALHAAPQLSVTLDSSLGGLRYSAYGHSSVCRTEGLWMSGPLTGLLVADFSRVLAGPYCTMLLADLGADVIKVESPGGDDTRNWVPPVADDGVSTYFLAINRNKRSVSLDLKDDGDLALARELARRADVFVENFKPGGLEKYGLGYDGVRSGNPDIIYASISGFGSSGGKELPGYDIIVQAMSGLMSLTGESDGPPFRSGISVFDVVAGLHTAIAILAALNHRNATGEGQHLESSLMASAMSGMVNQTSAYAAGGVVPFRMGNDHPSLFPYGPLLTGDGELVVAVGNDAQFRKLCELIGAASLPDDPRFATNPSRTANREELRRLLEGQLAGRTALEWFELLTQGGVPCGPINTVDGGIDAATKLGLEPVVTAGSGDRTRPVIRHPVTFSVTPPSYPLAPPELDEHGSEIREWLS